MCPRSCIFRDRALSSGNIAAFHAAGIVGRLAGSGTVNRFGERAVLVAACLAAASGLALATSTEQLAGVPAVGLLLTGISLSPFVPPGFSLTARSTPGSCSVKAISVVTSFGHGMSLVGPIAVGSLGGLITPQLTLFLFVPISLVVAFLAYWGLKG